MAKIINTICFTGHRPEGLFGYDMAKPEYKILFEKLFLLCRNAITHNSTRVFISGMAQGVDAIAFDVATFLKSHYPRITVIAAVPFLDQPKMWPDEATRRYHDRLVQADQIVYVDRNPIYMIRGLQPDSYTPIKMEKRNEYMVDRSDGVIAVWNGETKGGTYNCIKYVRQVGKPICILSPNAKIIGRS